MAVLVVDHHHQPLMPCSEKRARLLLSRQRAVVHRRAGYRRRCRTANLRHRPARFQHRRRAEKWLPPSLRSRIGNVLIWARGRGSYQRTNVNGSGFPSGYLTRQKRIRGFTTGDLVRAGVPEPLKAAGRHVGRVAVRASGSFQVGKTDGINAKYVSLLQRRDGYEYATV